MYVQPRYTKPAKYDNANFLSKFWFFYVFPTFWQGWKNNGLQMEDIDCCSVDDKSENVSKKLLRNWNEAVKKTGKPNLAWVLFRTFGCQLIIPLLACFYEECLVRIVQTLLVGQLIRYYNSDTSITTKWAWIYTGGVCFCTFLYVSAYYAVMRHVMRIGMRARTGCCALIYDKSLRLGQATIHEGGQLGQIVNIMTNDVNRFDEFGNFCPYLIVAPVEACIVGYFMWSYLGMATVAALLLLLLYILFQILMGRLFSNVRLATAIRTDTRLRYMNELISCMRIIKMYCWQKLFASKIDKSRKAEVSKIRRSLFLKAINLSIFYVYSRAVLFVCFVAFVLVSKERLNAEAVFVSISMFNILRTCLTYMFPNAVSLASELKVTCKRIEKFLLLKDKQEIVNSKDSSNNEPHVKVQSITASWNGDDEILNNISVDLKPGDLLAVIGPVGSGKTSFLMSLLCELPTKSGHISLEGSISYASQQAWSFSDTVGNNILFGSEFNAEKYMKVINVCALQRDLQLMPFGDETLVGENGVSLSGGQKARINLARAIYRDADICLLDDPLSAVDAPVAKHIFEKCIMEHLKTKIRILVTHQTQFIEHATKILVIKDGKSLAYGTFDDIQKCGVDFENLLSTKQKTDKENDEQQIATIIVESEQIIDNTKDNIQPEDITIKEKPKKVEEHAQQGSISWNTYWQYLCAGGSYVLVISMIIFSIISQACMNGSDIFLAYWTDKNQQESTKSLEGQSWDIIIYSSLIIALFITTIFRSFTFLAICNRASVRIHNNVLARMIKVPMEFFELNSSGRILNRFAKDLGIIDESLPNRTYDMTLNFTQAIGVMITVSIVNWVLIIPAIITLILLVCVHNIYAKSAFIIKRLEALARSPIYSQVSTTVNGLASIRAFGAQKSFIEQFHIYQNDHSATWFIYISCSRCIDMVAGLVSTVYISVVIVSMMLVNDVLGGNAGLAISSAILFNSLTQWTMRHTIESENQMTSVERLLEYQKLDQEPEQESTRIKPNQTQDNWPNRGEIEYDHLSLTYSKDQMPVLKEITFQINGGEKIGVVGRTGAGKSSLITALFRLVEPSAGSIRIDGIDIHKVKLADLRSKIAIIPQEPVIFSGTIRDNLDPFHEYSDSDLWSVLDEVQLKTQFSSNLESELSENGTNLSVGQRQLVCLARALLRRNRILILDEATANIDNQTDKLIQQTVRTKFNDCTVIIIAHRLNTIIECNRVMVLDAGQVVQFDSPYKMLCNGNGIFWEMCRKTGEEMHSYLWQIAQERYQQNQNQ